MNGWLLGLTANAIIGVAYMGVAVLLGINISKTKQWLTNPLAAGTFFLYVTCSGAHGLIAMQLAAATANAAATEGVRIMYGSAYEWYWDFVTAGIGIWYWTMRSRFPGLVSGTAVFEDLRQRQKRALQINDNIVQGLVRAKLSLDMKRDEEGKAALHETIAASRRIVASLEGGA